MDKCYHCGEPLSKKDKVCPRCGARMVLRTGQTGARKGQKYWGCSNYPVCRCTRNAEQTP